MLFPSADLGNPSAANLADNPYTGGDSETMTPRSLKQILQPLGARIPASAHSASEARPSTRSSRRRNLSAAAAALASESPTPGALLDGLMPGEWAASDRWCAIDAAEAYWHGHAPAHSVPAAAVASLLAAARLGDYCLTVLDPFGEGRVVAPALSAAGLRVCVGTRARPHLHNALSPIVLPACGAAPGRGRGDRHRPVAGAAGFVSAARRCPRHAGGVLPRPARVRDVRLPPRAAPGFAACARRGGCSLSTRATQPAPRGVSRWACGWCLPQRPPRPVPFFHPRAPGPRSCEGPCSAQPRPWRTHGRSPAGGHASGGPLVGCAVSKALGPTHGCRLCRTLGARRAGPFPLLGARACRARLLPGRAAAALAPAPFTLRVPPTVVCVAFPLRRVGLAHSLALTLPCGLTPVCTPHTGSGPPPPHAAALCHACPTAAGRRFRRRRAASVLERCRPRRGSRARVCE
jgi:hypothetical protein